MTKPKVVRFNSLKFEDWKLLPNGIAYEHWHDSIDEEYHLHFKDGMTIIFQHEDSKGSVTIEGI